MRKSPLSKIAVSKIALAAFAATTLSSAIGLGALAQERSQQFQRLPAELEPAQVEPLRIKPLKPSRPTREKRLPAERAGTPTKKTLTRNPVKGGPAQGGPDTPSQLANLVAIPYYNNTVGLPQGFPEHSYCMKNPAGGAPNQIRFWIRNAGGSDTGPFQWNPIFPNAGAATAMNVGNIPAYGQILVTQGIPDGCYSPGFSAVCEFDLVLDFHDDVEEWSEANTYGSYCVGPAG